MPLSSILQTRKIMSINVKLMACKQSLNEWVIESCNAWIKSGVSCKILWIKAGGFYKANDWETSVY